VTTCNTIAVAMATVTREVCLRPWGAEVLLNPEQAPQFQPANRAGVASGTGLALFKFMLYPQSAKPLILVTATLVMWTVMAGNAAHAAATVKVGMVTRNYTDETRKEWEGSGPRPLTTVIWYPVAPTGKFTFIFNSSKTPVFFPIAVASGAEPAPVPEKYPLVLLSHGTGSSALQMMWLGHHLASRGYIVAAVNHHGNTAEETRLFAQGAMLVWERPRDVSVVLDRLLADPLFGARIDTNRIGAAGFALGGYTVIALAGGRFSLDEYDAFCRSDRRDVTCEPQPGLPESSARMSELRKGDLQVNESIGRSNDSYRDPRIQRVFAIAPALGGGFTQRGLADVKVPVRIVVGAADTVAPLQTNAVHFAQLIPQAQLKTLPGKIGHYTFLANCTPYGQRTAALCKDAKGVDRAQVHREVANMAYEFFSAAATAVK
jgi:predicted dienelactone hydrolase